MPKSVRKLTESGKAHIIKCLNLNFKDSEMSLKELPNFKKRVFESWYALAEKKLNTTLESNIHIALGRIYFEPKHYAEVTYAAK
jgi:hypothetical protein